MKYRFSIEEIKMLEESKWWDLEPEQLKNIIYEDLKKFCEKLKKIEEV